MVNEFEEFALQFRKRTAARLLEFEAALDKAQTDVEKAAVQEARPRQTPEPETAPLRPREHGSRQVKGVLRRQ